MRNPRVSQQQCTAVMTTAHVRIVHFSTRIPFVFFIVFFRFRTIFGLFLAIFRTQKIRNGFFGTFFWVYFGIFSILSHANLRKKTSMRWSQRWLHNSSRHKKPMGFSIQKLPEKKTHAPMVHIDQMKGGWNFFEKSTDFLAFLPSQSLC